MLELKTLVPERGTLLFLGAHCDDVEIGCGGTILRLREERPDLDIRWAIFTGSAERRLEALESARHFLGEDAAERLRLHEFRDGFLPYQGSEVKGAFEAIKRELDPCLVFTHHRLDRHQDHRLVSELTWNTWRNHMILEYEIPKYDGELGQPNTFVSLTPEQVERKAKTLLEVYPSQTGKEWFDLDTLRSLPRLRGVESNAPERFAEGFYARKLNLNF
jgi:LmbE family N-acetylglucosaminyl deacetylase